MASLRAVELREAIAEHVRDGMTVALEGFTHLIPFAAGHEIIRQGRRDLTLVRMTPDLIYDQLIGMGCARKLIFSYGGNPGVGSLHRFRDAVENGWPRPLEIVEHSHAGHGQRATRPAPPACRSRVLRGYAGTDLVEHNDDVAFVDCPFTGEQLERGARRAPGRRGDPRAAGRPPRQRACSGASPACRRRPCWPRERAIVTVEEIVDELEPPPALGGPARLGDRRRLHVPGGAYPSYAHGYSARDNDFYSAWDEIARDRDRFTAWMREHVIERAGVPA